jgi:hypothetical protein
MTTNGDPVLEGEGPHGGEAILVFVMGLIGGATLIVVADRIHHLGPILGNALFSALPLIAVAASVARLRHHH